MLLHNLSYICKLIYETNKIPIIFINDQDIVEFEFNPSHMINPLYTSHQEWIRQFNITKQPVSFPLLTTTSYYENYFMIQILEQNYYKGTILVGPSLPIDLSPEQIHALVRDLTNENDARESLLQYYESLSQLSKYQFITISMQLYYMLYQEQLDPAEIIINNNMMGDLVVEIEDPQISISQRRENVSFHHDLMYEKKLFQYITEGRKEDFLKAYNLNPEHGGIGILSKKSEIRNKKNLGITAITLATRAAMEGGLHHEIAYTLSDLYIQELDELTNVNTIDSFMERALSDFADRVRKNKQQRYSKPINICLNHIYTYMYEDITLDSLAKLVDMHPNYLSFLFKKEVGTSLIEYIHKTKVDEAKSLLTFTDYSILKISTILNFHDQSYFTKVFKKYTGVTPKKYKDGKEKS